MDSDVARLVGVSVHTVRSWRHRGLGPPFYRVGGAVRYRRAEVLQWHLLTRQRGDGRVPS
jgi:excisionase family DNA binding protein